MTDREWIDSIKNVSTEELFERLEFIGCDGYYGDIWNAIIEELKNRVRPQGKGGKWIISEIRCPDCSLRLGIFSDRLLFNRRIKEMP